MRRKKHVETGKEAVITKPAITKKKKKTHASQDKKGKKEKKRVRAEKLYW
jgi:hypothetical protein